MVVMFEVEFFWVVTPCSIGILPQHYTTSQPTRPRLETKQTEESKTTKNLFAFVFMRLRVWVSRDTGQFSTEHSGTTEKRKIQFQITVA
jgi:hypothetical protein